MEFTKKSRSSESRNKTKIARFSYTIPSAQKITPENKTVKGNESVWIGGRLGRIAVICRDEK